MLAVGVSAGAGVGPPLTGIHRAITHDGLHDSGWDKFDATVSSAASDVGHFLEDAGETALSDLASLGNAMAHDAGAVGTVLGGLGLAALGGGGEVGGALLDATGIGAVLGVPAGVASAGLVATGLGIAGTGAAAIIHDAVGPDRVTMSSDGSSGGGDWDPSAERNVLGEDGMIDSDAIHNLSADDILKDNGQVLGKSTGRKMPVRTVRSKTDLDNIWDKISDGAPKPGSGQKISQYTRPDGTLVQYRITSSSGGETIDIDARAADGKLWKIHLPKAGS